MAQHKIVVDQSGHGNFVTIQSAMNSLKDSNGVSSLIFIRNGIYNEKIFIEKNNIVLEGESREKVIIIQSIARDEFRCNHADDWGVATVNVNGNDVTLKNLSVKNNYGFDAKEDLVIECNNDTTHKKSIRKSGHQMALRTMKATRFKALNCLFSSFGGDTVSPWNTDNGMFYFKDCRIEGGVDFYCPRGWAWAENCEFYAYGGTASIWHDGSKNPDSKSVLVNCKFSGFDGFYLGRYHRDAQMFLLDCAFDENMRDSSIYHVPKSSETPFGHRIYFYNCHRNAGDYIWMKNNLPTEIDRKNIGVDWVFKSKWHPQID